MSTSCSTLFVVVTRLELFSIVDVLLFRSYDRWYNKAGGVIGRQDLHVCEGSCIVIVLFKCFPSIILFVRFFPYRSYCLTLPGRLISKLSWINLHYRVWFCSIIYLIPTYSGIWDLWFFLPVRDVFRTSHQKGHYLCHT